MQAEEIPEFVEFKVENFNEILFSPDGMKIIVGTVERTQGTITGRGVKILDAKTGKDLQPLAASAELAKQICPVAFSPDGKKIVTACADKTIRIWDAETGKEWQNGKRMRVL